MANAKNYSVLNGKLNIIGVILKDFRNENHISRQQLSNKLMIMGYDIPSNSIYDIEAGTRTVSDYEVCAIAKALNLSVSYFLDDYYNSIKNK